MYEWVKNIILMTAFLAFSELLFPAGAMAKYLRLIFSLVFLWIVVYPLTMWLAEL